MMTKTFSRNLLGIITLLPFLVSCGGGGGGGGSATGAAFVRIDAKPRVIDTGDRILVSLQVADIHDNGISLKIRFPAELSFVEGSAVIDVEEEETGIVPDVQAASDSETYIVFYLSGNDFGRNEEGLLTFELQGREPAEDAAIEVDPDVDDPLIDNAIEFSVDAPLFSAEDQIHVRVED